MDKYALRDLRRSYQMARSQAIYRGEEWTLDIDLWMRLWSEDDRYLRKGRASDQLSFVRINPSLGWRPDNVRIETRRRHQRRMRNLDD
jgi:hypothetical protein